MSASRACVIEHLSDADETSALKILETYDDKAFSLCDALSFAVMDRRGVTRAVSFDGHFRQYGGGKFEVLP